MSTETAPSAAAPPIRKLKGKSKPADVPSGATPVEGEAATAIVVAEKPKIKVVKASNQIPADILGNQALNDELKHLPSNYNFEIHKTIWRLRTTKSKMVALQFPEGLLMYSCIIADILQKFAGVETLIMGDVTYGACCVDDYAAIALGCDFMVHYGHSCLVPVDVSQINMQYVFVDIAIDVEHFVKSMILNFKSTDRIVLAGTIQFASAIEAAKAQLKSHFKALTIPQTKPLSRGEVLGCTSPKFESGYDALVFLADGRFHLESIMIHNPHVPAFYKYDPYSKKLTLEKYGHDEMHSIRKAAIATASKAKTWGLILGTLGRQGNPNIMKRLEGLLTERKLPYVMVLLSEIFPGKLSQFPQVDAWVQVACPRLSIDWGYAFEKPLLSSYEAEVALQSAEWLSVYPMDYYSYSGGSWTNYAGGSYDGKAKLSASGAIELKSSEVAAEVEAAAAAAAAGESKGDSKRAVAAGGAGADAPVAAALVVRSAPREGETAEERAARIQERKDKMEAHKRLKGKKATAASSTGAAVSSEAAAESSSRTVGAAGAAGSAGKGEVGVGAVQRDPL